MSRWLDRRTARRPRRHGRAVGATSTLPILPCSRREMGTARCSCDEESLNTQSTHEQVIGRPALTCAQSLTLHNSTQYGPCGVGGRSCDRQFVVERVNRRWPFGRLPSGNLSDALRAGWYDHVCPTPSRPLGHSCLFAVHRAPSGAVRGCPRR